MLLVAILHCGNCYSIVDAVAAGSGHAATLDQACVERCKEESVARKLTTSKDLVV